MEANEFFSEIVSKLEEYVWFRFLEAQVTRKMARTAELLEERIRDRRG